MNKDTRPLVVHLEWQSDVDGNLVMFAGPSETLRFQWQVTFVSSDGERSFVEVAPGSTFLGVVERPDPDEASWYVAWQCDNGGRGHKVEIVVPGVPLPFMGGIGSRQIVNSPPFVAPGADLARHDLSMMDLSDADLSHADLTGADLSHNNIAGANLSHAVLVGADISLSTLRGANLEGANLEGANLRSTSSGGIIGVPLLLPTKFRLVRGYLVGPGCDLSDADLTNADLTGADLTATEMVNVNLEQVCLADARLNRVYCREASGTPSALPSGWQMIGGILIGPTANLAYRELSNLDLEGLDLSGADLTGVESEGIRGVPSKLPSGWRLASGYLVGTFARLRSAKLSGTDLSSATMSSVTLAKADLSHANLDGAQLDSADFSGANLRHASLRGANLAEAQMNGADLTGADLTGAILSWVKWLNTTCPDGTSSEASGGTCVATTM